MIPEEVLARLEAALSGARSATGELEAAVAAYVAATTTPVPVKPGKPLWLSGMDPNRDDDPFDELEAFGKWRGWPVRGMPVFHGAGFFGPGKRWEAMATSLVVRPGGQIDRILNHPNRYFVTMAQPLLRSDEAQRFDLLTSGQLDDAHRAIAKALAKVVRDRVDRFWLRLGWEANKGYPGSMEGAAKNQLAHYAAGWRRIALIYKQEIPGLQTTWNHLKDSRVPVALYYPGNEAVDVIGVDPYDNGYAPGAGFVRDERAWEEFLGSWDRSSGMIQGIRGFADFAEANDRGISYCEWGASNRTKTDPLTEDGSNNGFYAYKMLTSWMPSLGTRLKYECYFNGPAKHKVYPPQAILKATSDAYLAACRELASRA